jgi:hypothetical protein
MSTVSLSLPPALRPWSEQLRELVPALAIALGPLLLRLSAALGPFQSRPEPGRDNPEGFSGLSRRGLYDRLLVSEWALAEELPDEFTRRAASGEHLFLELERKTPRDGRCCRVLFDAGPDQLGHPRLAHLALLVVLDRRAQLAQAELQWQILQKAGPVRVGAGRQELLALLAGRSSSDPTSLDLLRCLDEGELDPGDELWVIGGRQAVALAPARASVLLIEEPWVQEQDQLTAVVSGGRRSRLELVLPLPEPSQRVALLRHPLVQPTQDALVPPVRRPLLRPLRPELSFSAEGHRLMTREVDGDLLAFSVPELRRKPVRTQLGEDARVVAMGWSHHRLGAVVRSGERTTLSVQYPEPSLQAGELQPIPNEQPSALYVIGEVAYFVDGGGQLWEWPLQGGQPARRSGVLGVLRLDGKLLVASDRTHCEGDPTLPPADRVWFGPDCLRALHLLDGSWLLLHRNGQIGQIGGVPARVHGVTWSGRPERRPALLVSDGPGHPLRLVHADGTELLLAQEVLAAACSSGGWPWLAWLDTAGALQLYDPIDRHLLASRHPEGT